ncbi:hypothetical protein P9139_10440 [Curtobacterium flaccumfaciens]|nr:hypothetical protein P9139_10440 [Curtobacterium flaccumfaciens]
MRRHPGNSPRRWSSPCARSRPSFADESVDTAGWGWTLTFLESKPMVALDDGTSIHLDDAGHAQVTNPDDAPEED